MVSGRTPVPILERIESRAINDWTDHDCWISDRAPAGVRWPYVQLARRFHGETIYRYQHVIAWEAFNAQPVPEGMVVMHTCDNPSCFNPNHLTVGTQSDNILDCIRKGRYRGGRKRKSTAS